jgi:hypothetical protein
MYYRLDDLDATSRDYLQQAWKDRGSQGGVVVPKGWNLPNWGGLRIILGLAALSLAGYLCLPKYYGVWVGQTILAGLGCLLVVSGGLALRDYRRNPKRMGKFFFADAIYLWDVSRKAVRVTSLEAAIDVNGTHHITNGAYSHSRLVVDMPGPPLHLTVHGRARAESLLKFINALIVLRKPTTDLTMAALARDPVMLGALALQLSRGEKSLSLANVDPAKAIPTPHVVGAPATKGAFRRAAAPWLAAAAAAALGALVFPFVDRYLFDEDMYAKTQGAMALAPLDDYLRRLPDGRHTAEVTEQRDDLRFTQGKTTGTQAKSPTKLRDYLADQNNSRHREEAQKMIDVFYDKAIARLKAAAASQEQQVHKPSFEALVALLEAVKTSQTPVVTVGFHATQDPAPTEEKDKKTEEAVYEIRLQQTPDLKDVANRLGGTALLPLGEVFSPEQTRRREALILDLLRRATNKVLKEDILSMTAAAPGQKAVLEVGYHIYPSGTLYTYWEPKRQGNIPFAPVGDDKNYKGLLRGYAMDWTLTVRPPGTLEAAAHVCKLPSAPANQLKYDDAQGDPDWAPYAIILYSGFFDMSSRLIKGFALEPEPTPASYSFYQVTTGRRP